MFVYLKNALLDFLLCVAASASLTFTVMSGFYSTQPYQGPLGVLGAIAACAVLTAALFAASLNLKARLIGGIVLAVAIAGLLAFSVASSSVAAPLDDEPGNRLYPALCLVLPSLTCFLLSRWKAGCVVLGVAGTFACALIEYLYWYGHLVALLVFFGSCIALYAYRTYQRSLLDSESEHLAFASVTAAGAAIAVVAVAAAFGVFALAIQPLDPPNLVVKLITEHYRPEEKEVRGIGSTDQTLDDEQTDSLDDEVSQSSELSDAQTDASDDTSSPLGSVAAGLASLTMNFPDWWPLVAALALLALVAAVIGSRKLIRRRRFARMTGQDTQQAVQELYLFFLRGFERLKFAQPKDLTLAEYADSFSDTFRKFEQHTNDSEFGRLTRVYVGQVYGARQTADEELAQFKDYYAKFYKRACAYAGRLRYCRLFFRL